MKEYKLCDKVTFLATGTDVEGDIVPAGSILLFDGGQGGTVFLLSEEGILQPRGVKVEVFSFTPKEFTRCTTPAQLRAGDKVKTRGKIELPVYGGGRYSIEGTGIVRKAPRKSPYGGQRADEQVVFVTFDHGDVYTDITSRRSGGWDIYVADLVVADEEQEKRQKGQSWSFTVPKAAVDSDRVFRELTAAGADYALVTWEDGKALSYISVGTHIAAYQHKLMGEYDKRVWSTTLHGGSEWYQVVNQAENRRPLTKQELEEFSKRLAAAQEAGKKVTVKVEYGKAKSK